LFATGYIYTGEIKISIMLNSRCVEADNNDYVTLPSKTAGIFSLLGGKFFVFFVSSGLQITADQVVLYNSDYIRLLALIYNSAVRRNRRHRRNF